MHTQTVFGSDVRVQEGGSGSVSKLAGKANETERWTDGRKLLTHNGRKKNKEGQDLSLTGGVTLN